MLVLLTTLGLAALWYCIHCIILSRPEPNVYKCTQCEYGVFSKNLMIHTIVHRVHKRFWPTLLVSMSASVQCGSECMSYTSYRMSYTSYHMRYTSYHMSYTSYHMSYTSYHMSYTSYHMRYTSYHMSYTSYHISYTSYHISYTSYRMSYASYQMSYTSYHI